MKNFTNGSLVFRVWGFDGGGEIIAKFQYYPDARAFAEMLATNDREHRPEDSKKWFYLAVCDNENDMRAYFPIKPEGRP